ncbi:MAG: hypothetical protein ACXWIU_10030 [Limisphaerales bacterium]
MTGRGLGLPQLGARAAYAKQAIQNKLMEHKHYIREHGDDIAGDPRLEVERVEKCEAV